MKLIVQIPCLNEEQTLPLTIRDIPKSIDGIDEIEILVIDDGSSDRTLQVARDLGVDHIIRNTTSRRLAQTFFIGLDACLKQGADIIVNTDGDNQYDGNDIPKLIAPILRGEADFVVGTRHIDSIEHFSGTKKVLQKLGSFVVRTLIRTPVADVVSGFRAFSREAALRITILSRFSYTLETLIQADHKALTVASVPISTNPKTRESRLFSNIFQFVQRSAATIIRLYAMYSPLKVFTFIAALFLVAGLIPSVRFLIYYFSGSGSGHIQSLIFAAVLFTVGFQILLIGLLADIISFNRRLIEEILLRVKYLQLENYKHRRIKTKIS